MRRLPTFANSHIAKEYTRSFSTVKYTDIAPHFGLDPNRKGRDISLLDVYRSRLSPELIMDVMKSVEKAEKVYGRLFEHQTEKVRDRYVQSVSPPHSMQLTEDSHVQLFSDIFAVFNARLKDESEGLLGSALTGDGLIEHLFVSFDSVSSFFLEMQIPAVEEGVVRLDQHAQVMAEAAGMLSPNRANVPMCHCRITTNTSDYQWSTIRTFLRRDGFLYWVSSAMVPP